MNGKALRHILSRSEWFAALPPALAEGIVAEARIRRFRNQPIYLTGDAPNGLFLLLAGEVRIVHYAGDGSPALLGATNPGTWFGESSMLDGRPRFSDAVAIGEASVLQLAPPAFRKLTEGSAAHYAAFTRLLCEHYRLAIAHIVSTATLPAMTRLAQRLLYFAEEEGRSLPGRRAVEFRLSQKDLATTVGISRQTLNGLLKQLETQGLIETGYARIILKKPAALQRLARREPEQLPQGGS
ncbi:Crp/Fnr family transcriptional regulator [Parvibaculum sp.]|uniref:Crp/Fnr family transcriptional regulator n=1 Tax=Parvibaculum sp. TaxID=2024848 RepID=UPI0027314813|nr:Crp/Fnr family transcriptional regulator [Parvibaculum sp.]MDP1627151.1 Crp/Fnr family transcriptional regulator [Parvibaculum sp.]MDP2148857.1 Crp/Fnr family transcriptional regulator [Parvibaculum sp.]MDP3329906.1 Crp/Fnr family transcriptional regulator [Parvibaculum sp.]